MQYPLFLQSLESRELLALDADIFIKAQKTDNTNWSNCALADVDAFGVFLDDLFNPQNSTGTDNTRWQACVAFFKSYSDIAATVPLANLADQQALVQSQFTSQNQRATDHANCATSSAQLTQDLPDADAVIASRLSLANYPCAGLSVGDVDTSISIFQIVVGQNIAVDTEEVLKKYGL